MNKIKAAASPMRKLTGKQARDMSESPRTPRSAAAAVRARAARGESGSPGGQQVNVVSQAAVTPMKRVPILANFEEWMKMATDNKINAANSWNFALIDYFHDMSLLKEGDSVNFQKASCTLDGCVKIYTSRVDSVATETGKLLSGLADSGNKKGKERVDGEEGEEGEEEDEEEDEDGNKKAKKKKPARSHEATLAPSFASLQLKKLELEFTVDPLFKKASADFDEGGAKGLLLNHLSIDSEGRIVFDSSDDAGDATPQQDTTQTGDEDAWNAVDELADSEPPPDTNDDIDLHSLTTKFFPDLSILDSQDICPSMKSFRLGDPSSDLNLNFLKPPEDWRERQQEKTPAIGNLNLGDQTGMFLDGTNAAGFDDDDDGGLLGGFDLAPDAELPGFGEGGEAWAREAALEPMLRVAQGDGNDGPQDGIAVGDFDPANPQNDAYAVSLNHRGGNEHENILFYFDNALKAKKSGWAGPEHWRISKIKAANAADSTQPVRRERKEKEPYVIDFLAPMTQAEADSIYTPASNNSTISLPKAQWKTKGRNLLPDDRHFNSRSLLTLFLKPKARLGRRKNVAGLPSRDGGTIREDNQYDEMDEAYWAKRKEEEEAESRKGDYDANFFADDDAGLPFVGGLPDDDDDEQGPAGFTDAREMLSPPPSQDGGGVLAGSQESQAQNHMLPGSFGSQLVTQGAQRLRPEYVNYARVAKKVDVRRLKENMWRGMSVGLMAAIDGGPPTPEPDGDVDMMDVDAPPPKSTPTPDASAGGKVGAELKFTDMIGGLRGVYPEQQMRDISTSYCFICLLHLANEKGLVLEGEEDGGMQEIRVRRDRDVGEGYVGE